MSRDFVEFINSEDVKQYVRETGYQLSSQEAAFVVWQSKNTPLEERFAAWEEIIETMPDSSFAGYGKFSFKTKQMESAPVYSLHDFLRQYIQRQRELLEAFTKEGDGTYALEKREGPWMGGEINDWFSSEGRYGRYGDVMEDMEMEKGWGCFNRMRVQKITNCGSMRTKTSMPNILTLDYDMDAQPLRFVYRDDFRHRPSIRTSWKNSSPSWRFTFPPPSGRATSFGIPPGSRAFPTRRTARPSCWTTSPTGTRRNRRPTGLFREKSSTSEKGRTESMKAASRTRPGTMAPTASPW